MNKKIIKTDINLVPNIINSSPDYYCTWQTQLFATSGGEPIKQRVIICENSLFSNKKPYGWAYFYEKIRSDLLFVMDDSWDVGVVEDKADFGCLVLNGEKFPLSTKDSDNKNALKNLSTRLKGLGWKGLGGWVYAGESTNYLEGKTLDEYYIKRLQDANYSNFSLWKVDWGKRDYDIEFRKNLTKLQKKYAPNLVIEHAITEEIVPDTDLYRTYDVPAIASIPMTMEKLYNILKVYKKGEGKALLNCEDEVYIASAGGFVMGVMRHPYVGNFPNGEKDRSFPKIHRNIKSKIYEVIRAVNWHKIAPAYSVDSLNTYFSDEILTDTWRFKDKTSEIENWWFNKPAISDFISGGVLKKSAVSTIARNTKLPNSESDKKGNKPFIIASLNPSGAYSIATLGRTINRKYYIPKCNVTAFTNTSNVIGVFGEYKTLTLDTSLKVKRVLMQDLASDFAYDITSKVKILDGKVIVDGKLISRIGKSSQPKDDTSEPGVIIKLN